MPYETEFEALKEIIYSACTRIMWENDHKSSYWPNSFRHPHLD